MERIKDEEGNDLVVVGTPEEELWTKVKEGREQSIKALEESLIIEREFLKAAIKKLEDADTD